MLCRAAYAEDRELYDSSNVAGADGTADQAEANRHSRHGNGAPVTTNVSDTSVKITGTLPDGRIQAEFNGDERWVYGRVLLNPDGTVIPELYDFEQRSDRSTIGNVLTQIGANKASVGGSFKLQKFNIYFIGKPNISNR